MTDDKILDAVVEDARQVLAEQPPTNGDIARMLPPKLRREFMLRGLRERRAELSDDELPPSMFDTMDEAGMDEAVKLAVTVSRWHAEAARALAAQRPGDGDLGGLFEYMIEDFVLKREAGKEWGA